MEWQDQDAPIILGEMKERTYTFDEAAAFILENFKNSVPKWLILRKKPLKKLDRSRRSSWQTSWRLCTSLPETRESRIFMTYSNSVNEVATFGA